MMMAAAAAAAVIWVSLHSVDRRLQTWTVTLITHLFDSIINNTQNSLVALLDWCFSSFYFSWLSYSTSVWHHALCRSATSVTPKHKTHETCRSGPSQSTEIQSITVEALWSGILIEMSDRAATCASILPHGRLSQWCWMSGSHSQDASGLEAKVHWMDPLSNMQCVTFSIFWLSHCCKTRSNNSIKLADS